MLGDPEGYERKVLQMGISLHGGSVGQPGVGSSTRDFERRMKGALEVECLSLKRLSGEGLKGGSFNGGPERYVKKGSGYRHLSPQGPVFGCGEPETWEGTRTPGTLIE